MSKSNMRFRFIHGRKLRQNHSQLQWSYFFFRQWPATWDQMCQCQRFHQSTKVWNNMESLGFSLLIIDICGFSSFQVSIIWTTITFNNHVQISYATTRWLNKVLLTSNRKTSTRSDHRRSSSTWAVRSHLSGGFFELQSGLTFFHTSRSHGMKERYDGFWSHPWNGILILGKNSFILFLEWRFDTGLKIFIPLEWHFDTRLKIFIPLEWHFDTRLFFIPLEWHFDNVFFHTLRMAFWYSAFFHTLGMAFWYSAFFHTLGMAFW